MGEGRSMSLSIGTKATIAVLSVNAVHPGDVIDLLPLVSEEDMPAEQNELLQQICRAMMADDPEAFDAAMAKLKEIAAQ